MTTLERSEARADMVRYHKCLITGALEEAIRIEQKYELFGYPPQIVSIGLQAASEGRDHLVAIDDYLNGED